MKKVMETEIIADSGKQLKITYFLLQKENTYGISSELLDGETVIDSEIVQNLWEDKEIAISCIKQLAVNTVTPTTLIEVLDENFF